MSCENKSQSGSGSCGTSRCESMTYIISILVLVMVVVNCGTILATRSLQDDLGAQQNEFATKTNKISQNTTFANISQSLIQALTVAARKDEQIKALLIQNQPAATKEAPAK